LSETLLRIVPTSERKEGQIIHGPARTTAMPMIELTAIISSRLQPSITPFALDLGCKFESKLHGHLCRFHECSDAKSKYYCVHTKMPAPDTAILGRPTPSAAMLFASVLWLLPLLMKEAKVSCSGLYKNGSHPKHSSAMARERKNQLLIF
jgi:hypothetical protein